MAPDECRAHAEAVLKHHRGWVSETNNKDLARVASANSIQLVSPRSGCDCGTILDNPRYQNLPDLDREKLAEKLRRKGWTEAKIERSLADKEHGMATTTHRGPTDSFELWETILSEMLERCSSGAVGLLLHSYSGSIDDEEMKLIRRRVSAKQSMIDALRSLKEDEFLLFDRAWLRARSA